MKKLAIALSVLGFAAAPAFAAPSMEFTAADADGDGQIIWEEAQAAGLTEEQFTAADADSSGTLNKQEYESAA